MDIGIIFSFDYCSWVDYFGNYTFFNNQINTAIIFDFDFDFENNIAMYLVDNSITILFDFYTQISKVLKIYSDKNNCLQSKIFLSAFYFKLIIRCLI